MSLSENRFPLFRDMRLRRAAGPEPGFERGYARFERLVLLARQPRHLLDRLELLALDQIEVAQDAFGLVANDGFDLAPHARGGTCRVVHQPRDLVEEAVGGLRHHRSRVRMNMPSPTMGTDGVRRKPGSPPGLAICVIAARSSPPSPAVPIS